MTVSGSTLTIPTEDSVEGGDTVLFVIPSPWSVTGNLTARVSQGGTVQASTTFAINDRVGTRLTGGDVVADEEMKIVLATDWRSLVHPVGTGTGASLSDSTPDTLTPDQSAGAGTGTSASRHDHSHGIFAGTPSGLGAASAEGSSATFSRADHVHDAFDTTVPSSHGIGQSGAPGTSTTAARRDHVHAIPVGTPVATGDANAEGTATTASRSDHVHQGGVFSWGFVIDTLIVPELNQDAITDARIVLEDSGLTHYLTFLDWTAGNLDMISHLPVGAHIGLRQGTTTRILRVEAEWDSTNDQYQVINVNTGILTESASGTATELLLTAGVGGGTAFDLHEDVTTAISTLDSNDRFVVSDENLSGDPNRYVSLDALATKLAGTNLTASAGVLSASGGGGGGGGTDFTRTLIGTSTSMGTTVVTLNLSEAIEDGELLEILWLASAGGRNYGQSFVSADAILDLTAQASTPGSVSAAMQFKIGDTATGLNAFGHGSGYVWLIDTDSIYLANGRQRAMVAEVYKLVAPAGGGSAGPGDEVSDNSISVGVRTFDETSMSIPSGTWGFVNFGDIGSDFSGEWFRFLIADLEGVTASIDNGAISDANSLMFFGNEEYTLYLGRTSGNNVLAGASNNAINPGTVRIRTN